MKAAGVDQRCCSSELTDTHRYHTAQARRRGSDNALKTETSRSRAIRPWRYQLTEKGQYHFGCGQYNSVHTSRVSRISIRHESWAGFITFIPQFDAGLSTACHIATVRIEPEPLLRCSLCEGFDPHRWGPRWAFFATMMANEMHGAWSVSTTRRSTSHVAESEQTK